MLGPFTIKYQKEVSNWKKSTKDNFEIILILCYYNSNG
jgi:hypothetical protein